MPDTQPLRTAHASFGPFVLRIGLGVVFLAHAYAKAFVFTLAGTERFFQTNGFPALLAYPVFALELLGGLALLLGARTRLVSAGLIVVMLGALKPHLSQGWMFTEPGGGWEYVAFLLVALASLLLSGPGALAFEPRATVSGSRAAAI